MAALEGLSILLLLHSSLVREPGEFVMSFNSVSAHTCIVPGVYQASAMGFSLQHLVRNSLPWVCSQCFWLVPLVLQGSTVSQSAEKRDCFSKFSPVFLIAHINISSH